MFHSSYKNERARMFQFNFQTLDFNKNQILQHEFSTIQSGSQSQSGLYANVIKSDEMKFMRSTADDAILNLSKFKYNELNI